MNFTYRLKRLEGRLGCGRAGGPPCAICHAEGMPGLEVTRDVEQRGAIKGGCPGCRRVSILARMILPIGPGEDPASDPWDGI